MYGLESVFTILNPGYTCLVHIIIIIIIIDINTIIIIIIAIIIIIIISFTFLLPPLTGIARTIIQ
jgi:hypothetical protein